MLTRTRYLPIVLVATFRVALTVAQPDNQQESEKTAQTDPPHEAASLSFGLTSNGEFETDAALIREMAARADALVQRAKAASSDRDRIDLLLRAANMILAKQLEPPCSRALLGIETDQVKAEKADHAESLNRASDLLNEARTALKDHVSAPDDDDDFAMIRQQRLDMLSAFHDALHAYLLYDDGEDAARKWRDAASELSAFLEDPDREIVDAAKLWHALLRRREPDRRALLDLLDPVVSEATQPVSTHEFFGRLMRCELIAERGGYAGALALLLQLEESAHVWQFAGADREDAVRLIAFRQIHVLEQWKAALASDDKTTERTWCDDRIQALIAEHFTDSTHLLRLGAAIPIVSPDPDAPESDTPKPRREE